MALTRAYPRRFASAPEPRTVIATSDHYRHASVHFFRRPFLRRPRFMHLQQFPRSALGLQPRRASWLRTPAQSCRASRGA